jgi:hypothetical protein
MRTLSPAERIEAHQKRLDVQGEIPDEIPLLELADQVVRGKIKLSAQQMRMLIEMLPYVAPKLLAVGHGSIHDMGFASRLDRALARSDTVREKKPLMIEDLRGR